MEISMKNNLLSVGTFKLISHAIAMFGEEKLKREEKEDIVLNVVNSVADDVSKDLKKDDLATKGDLENVNLTLKQEIALLRSEFKQARSEFKQEIAESKTDIIKWFVGSQIAFLAILVAILKLL